MFTDDRANYIITLILLYFIKKLKINYNLAITYFCSTLHIIALNVINMKIIMNHSCEKHIPLGHLQNLILKT